MRLASATLGDAALGRAWTLKLRELVADPLWPKVGAGSPNPSDLSLQRTVTKSVVAAQYTATADTCSEHQFKRHLDLVAADGNFDSPFLTPPRPVIDRPLKCLAARSRERRALSVNARTRRGGSRPKPLQCTVFIRFSPRVSPFLSGAAALPRQNDALGGAVRTSGVARQVQMAMNLLL